MEKPKLSYHGHRVIQTWIYRKSRVEEVERAIQVNALVMSQFGIDTVWKLFRIF